MFFPERAAAVAASFSGKSTPGDPGFFMSVAGLSGDAGDAM
jgi:hypothetical protein